MQRTDITDIFPEATKEQIDKLMTLNGNDINAAKGELAELTNQLTAAQAALAAAPTVDSTALDSANARLAELEAQLAAMQAADEARQLRARIAKEKNLPAEVLTGDTEEACLAQADAINGFLAASKATPSLTVADGGEPRAASGASPRAQFADWGKTIFE